MASIRERYGEPFWRPWSQPVGGSAPLWDLGACPVPLEAGTDAGGTAVRGSRDHRGACIMTLLPRGREGSPRLRLYRHAQGHRWARDAGPGRCCSRIPSRATCVYRKLKPGRNDGEARRGSGANE
jgi:hypothetical protein